MNVARPDMTDLAAFAAIARHRSFRRAADELSVSPSTLSHLMKHLETRVGVRLLHRTTRSVSLTEAGSALLVRLEPVFRDLDRALGAIDDYREAPRGVLRINTMFAGARILVRTAVPTFLERFPEMQIELVTEQKLVDIVADGFDAGVRLAESVPQDMVAVPFGGRARFIAVASPDYVKRHGAPRTPGDLAKHACIRQRMRSGKLYRWELEKRGQAITVEPTGPVTLDNEQLMVDAAKNGLGIAFVSDSHAKAALESGELVTLLEPWCPSFDGLCLYYPGHRHVPRGLRAFLDIVKETSGVLRRERARKVDATRAAIVRR